MAGSGWEVEVGAVVGAWEWEVGAGGKESLESGSKSKWKGNGGSAGEMTTLPEAPPAEIAPLIPK